MFPLIILCPVEPQPSESKASKRRKGIEIFNILFLIQLDNLTVINIIMLLLTHT